MDFLTDKFLIPANRFDGPVLVTGAGGCIGLGHLRSSAAQEFPASPPICRTTELGLRLSWGLMRRLI